MTDDKTSVGCQRDRLRACLDGEGSEGERAGILRHLESCGSCRAEYERLADLARFAGRHLSVLEARSDEGTEPDGAYARFRLEDAARQAGPPPKTGWARRLGILFGDGNGDGAADGSGSTFRRRPLRLAAAGLAAAGALVFAVSYAPARQVLAEFLQIFRVRELSVVQIDSDRLSKLAAAARGFTDSTMIRVEGERMPQKPEQVSGVEEASSRAGFPVRVPTGLSADFLRRDFSVMQGPALRVHFDRERVEEALSSAGLGEIDLPDLPADGVRIDVPVVVHQLYEHPQGASDTTRVAIVQLQSPTLSLPSGVDARAFGKAYLQLLGVPPEEARRMAERIDWTGTLVLPMPRNLASVQEIDLRGQKALLLVSNPQPPQTWRQRMLLWQEGGVLSAVSGERIGSEELGRLAESLR